MGSVLLVEFVLEAALVPVWAWSACCKAEKAVCAFVRLPLSSALARLGVVLLNLLGDS